MTCPFHTDDSSDAEAGGGDGPAGNGGVRESGDGPTGSTGGVGRRSFVQSALLIGGAGALSGLADAVDVTPATRAPDEHAGGRIGRAARHNRQHAWDAHENEVATGNTAQPASSLILLLEYVGDGAPAPDHRRQVEGALRGIERHFAWDAEGVLFTIGYSAAYFDRFEADPPPGAAPWPAERVVAESSAVTPFDPEPDVADAVLVLASENPANTLAAEAALWGEEGPEVPSFEDTFEGVFEQPETWPARRVGEAGPAFQDTEATYEEFLGPDVHEDIPDESPLSMGFIAGFGDSIPAEDAVTLTHDQRFPGPGIDADDVPTDLPYVGEVGGRDPGVFAQGTLKHLSYLTIDLEEWYGTDRDRRRRQMYSPYHGADETTSNDEKPGNELTTGERGDAPGSDTLVARNDGGGEGSGDGDSGDDTLVYGETVPETATEGTEGTDGEPTLAHSQKAARARYDLDGDGEVEQPCLRRDWDGIRPDTGEYGRRAGYHFNVPMRFNESILTLLDANYGPEFRSLDGRIEDADIDAAAETTGDGARNGLVPFMEVTRRNNWLVPPITLRALPFPRADAVDIEVDSHGDYYYVTVTGELGPPGSDDRPDPGTVRFGSPEQVNTARGAGPDSWAGDYDGNPVFLFERGEVDAGAGDRVKFFAKRRDTGKPLTGETDL